MNIYLLAIVLVLGVGAFVGSNYLNNFTTPEERDAPPEVVQSEDIIDQTTNSDSSIDLSGTGLTSVPKYVFERTEIETLNLSQNSLSGSLPAEVRHLKNLRVLNLSENNFTGVPAEIGQLQNLEVLDLSGNPITGLPHELANLKKLKILDLRGTTYSTLDLNIIKAGLSGDVVIQL